MRLALRLPASVAEAWRVWQATHLPTDSFRTSDGHALTYGVECDLDHQASYLVALVEAFAAKNPHWDFTMRAAQELGDLRIIRERVEALELPAETEVPLIFYIDATERLLRAIVEAASGGARGTES